MAQDNTIPDIAKRSPQNQRQGHGLKLFIRPESPHPNHKHHTDNQCYRYKEPALPARCIAQEAEGSSRVIRQRKAEKGRNGQLLIQRKMIIEIKLGALIQHYHYHRQP
ncbi:hypothetical protein ElyMa_003744700 [Elysia marginata]|uniref:Uncharacterized protein n=1 Tax=Elysia marginata TaxID=1093978 RepID=A0AAV4F936_9GAST|nr:hypothetical protein ElyMa_003744700 [Elysia marginata]